MLDVNKLFKGKTIEFVDTPASNVWVFKFTDGTQQSVWAECGSGDYDFPYFEIYEEGE
jgi:hypothetical protein